MGRIVYSFAAIVLFAVPIPAQSNAHIGFNAQFGIPLGETANRLDIGYGGGLWFIVPVSEPFINLALGAGYETYEGVLSRSYAPGFSGNIMTTAVYGSSGLGFIFTGPKIGRESGLYFLPAISLNIADEARIGFDIGGGIIQPTGRSSIGLNVALRYSRLNAFGRNEGELPVSILRLSAGIVL